MKGFMSVAALGLTTMMIFASGCVATPEHRMNVAASRDEARRNDFERCRAEGRGDCDAILNAPVESNSPPRGDSVRAEERRNAYDRCVARGGTDCDDILHR
jgi:hypothetical protein